MSAVFWIRSARIAWTSVANTVRESMAAAAGGAVQGAAASSTGEAGASAVPQAILHRGLTEGFSTGLVIAGLVAMSGFFVAVFATRTPGYRWRLLSSRHRAEAACDEVLGTCDQAGAAAD